MTDHYKQHPSGVEAIELTRHESFLRGNILKYVLRAPYKGSELQDLKKAAEYLQWEIERVESDTGPLEQVYNPKTNTWSWERVKRGGRQGPR